MFGLVLKNRWTTIVGALAALGTLLTCAAQVLGGDMGGVECLKESWATLALSAGLIFASDAKA